MGADARGGDRAVAGARRARTRSRSSRRRRSAARCRGATRRHRTPTSRPRCSRRRAGCSATPATATTRSSNWAKPGYECRHNLGYWERRPYVGLGAGAHGYRDGRRWWNVRPPEEYLSTVERGELPVGGSEELEPADAYLEEVFLGSGSCRASRRAGSRTAARDPYPAERSPPRRRRQPDPDRARHVVVERACPRPHRVDPARDQIAGIGVPQSSVGCGPSGSSLAGASRSAAS